MSQAARVPRWFAFACLMVCCGPAAVPAPQSTQPPTSRCTSSAEAVSCQHQTLRLRAATLERNVHWQTPVGDAPATGWPVVLLFQGSGLSARTSWAARAGDAFGSYHQTQVVRRLLDDGFMVLAPEAKLDGTSYWDTNIPPWATAWASSEDHALMVAVFEALANGAIGPSDLTRLFAAGLSSGGYMASRMAEAYPGRFTALAIASASWATCGGWVCALPNTLPAAHPPTLFLHGEQDFIVPIATARLYERQLRAEGHEVKFVSDAATGHAWLAVAPAEVAAFFAAPR